MFEFLSGMTLIVHMSPLTQQMDSKPEMKTEEDQELYENEKLLDNKFGQIFSTTQRIQNLNFL